jgi:hypothetical protein
MRFAVARFLDSTTQQHSNTKEKLGVLGALVVNRGAGGNGARSDHSSSLGGARNVPPLDEVVTPFAMTLLTQRRKEGAKVLIWVSGSICVICGQFRVNPLRRAVTSLPFSVTVAVWIPNAAFELSSAPWSAPAARPPRELRRAGR